MNPAGNPGILPPRFRTSILRRYFLRGIVLVAIAPVLLFLLSNLWLSSPWGCRWVAGKISARAGLEARLDGVSWSPWNGIHLRGLTISQPTHLSSGVAEPLVRAESIRLWPVWKAWLKKRPELSSIEIEQPRVVIPLQLFSHLTPAASPPPTGPAVTVNETPAAPPHAVSPPLSEVALSPISPPETPPASETPTTPPIPTTPSSAPTVPSQETPVPTPSPIARPHPTVWVSLRGGSVALVTKGTEQILFEGRGLDADLPLSGAPATSSARIDSFTLFGNQIASSLSLPIHWQAPVLSVTWSEQAIAGITFQGSAKIGLLPGLPVQVEVECPTQKNLAWDWPQESSARIEEFHAAAQFQGYLSHRTTWQGNFLSETQKTTAQFDGHTEVFDHGGMVATLRNGVFHNPDTRFIGDTLSLLANATVLPDGRGAAVLRIVAEPSVAKAITARFQAVGLPLSFAPLGTPDRLAIDLTLYTYPNGELLLQLGEGENAGSLDTPNTLRLIKALCGASP